MKVYTSLLLCLLGVGNILFGQGRLDVPNVIPPSPVAADLNRYGSYPISHFTGVPEIEIPIFTIQEGDIEVPISMKYHASGVKVNQSSGFYGMGWSLVAGGLITIDIKGESDSNEPPFSNPNFTDPVQFASYSNDKCYAYHNIESGGAYNAEYDVYTYNFLGNYGQFTFKNDVARTPFLFPFRPLKININSPLSGRRMYDALDITDEKGILYRFGPIDNQFGGYISSGDTERPSGSSWLIGQIVSPLDSSNKVNFKYDEQGIQEYFQRYELCYLDDYASFLTYYSCIWNLPMQRFDETNSYNDIYYKIPATFDNGNQLPTQSFTYPSDLLTEISFKSGKLQFSYNPTNKMLSKIEIFDSNNQLIRYLTLDITLFPGQTSRYRLKTIKFYDGNNNYINQYSFDYTGEQSGNGMPPYETTNEIDFWGYWNHKGGQNLLHDWQNLMFFLGNPYPAKMGRGNRWPDGNYMKMYNIEAIHYPTGGKTVFEFEPNRYNCSTGCELGDNGEAGGLRVTSITNYADDGHIAERKFYHYGVDESGYGEVALKPKRELYSRTAEINRYHTNYGAGYSFLFDYRETVFSSEPNVDLAPYGSPVCYPQVTEYVGDEQGVTGKTVYNYNFTLPDYTLYSIDGFSINTTGGTNNFPVNNKEFIKNIKPWTVGQLELQSFYKKTLSNNYQWIKSTDYSYEEVNRDVITNLNFYRYFYHEFGPDCSISLDENDFCDLDNLCYWPYRVALYNLVSGEMRLTRKIETLESVSTTTEYTYANDNLTAPTKSVTKNSKDEDVIVNFKYAYDFKSSTTTPNQYDEMINRNIVAPVIEESKYNGTDFLESVKTNYQQWNASLIAPSTIETVTSPGGSPETRLRFMGYNSAGNITGVSKEKDTKQAFLWGYKDHYPIAKAINATPDQIAYTSFEMNADMGGWSYSNNGYSNAGSRTGRYSYNLTPTTPITSSLAAGNYKLVYYTQGTTAVQLTGAAVITTYPTTSDWSGWTKHTLDINITSTLTLGVSSGGLLVDELRIHPIDAQMTTYTYQPLVGMTSFSDTNSVITFYDYDSFGRLQTIRDDSGNVTKGYTYHYKN